MSKRSIHKVRHYKPAPTFAERVKAGMENQIKELWAKYGFGGKPIIPAPGEVLEVVDEEAEHVHGEHCNHDH